jgi:hypothetical protein
MSEKFKPVWSKPTTTFDWCQYDGDGGMFTVRRTVTHDAAKFKTQTEAMGYVDQQTLLASREHKDTP